MSLGVIEVDAPTVKSWLDEGRALLVDVREPDERAAEFIPESDAMPLSKLDPGAMPRDVEKKLVLHCKGGKRSTEAAARLAAAGRTEALSLRGGIEAWKAAGFAVTRARAVPKLGVMRQVQLTLGVVLLVSAGLSALVSAWFLLLIAGVGAGLVFAGATGTCGLASLLSIMPWNRAFRAVNSYETGG